MLFTRKKLIATVTSIFAATSAYSFEWGGLVSGSGKFYNNSEKFSQVEDPKPTTEITADASLWCKVPFSKDGESYLIAEGTYEFEHDINIGGSEDSDNSQYIDLDLFKIALLKPLSDGDDPSTLSFAIGRFSLSDLSNTVFTQNADGLLVKYNSTFIGLSAYGAYTGLLNGKTVSILSCYDEDTYEEDPDKLYDRAEAYAVGSLSVSFNNIFANQTLALEGFGTFRTKGESFNRFYGTVGMNGPLVAKLFYNISTTFGYTNYGGDEDALGFETGLGNLTKANLTYFTSVKDATFGLSGAFASKKFYGFTSNTAVMAQREEQYQGVLVAGPFASIKPVNVLLLSASADFVCDNLRGDEGDSFGFAGIQIGGGIACQAFSDLSFNFSATQFIDKDDSENNKTTLTLKAVLTF